VIAEGIQCGSGHGVHGVRPDQLFDIDHIPESRVLGARARPEQPLRLRSLPGQRLPARRPVDLLVALIREPGIGEGHLPEQPSQHGLLLRIDDRAKLLGEEEIHGSVDPADEEAGHACDVVRAASSRQQPLQAGHERVRDRFVGLHAEQQRHVDVDAFAGELAAGRESCRGAGDLDQQIGTSDGRPEPPRLLQRPGRIVGQVGRDLQADVAIPSLGLLVDRPEQIRGLRDVLDGELLVEGFPIEIPLLLRRLQRRIVIGAAGDRLRKNGRVGGHPTQPILPDQGLKCAGSEQTAADVVEPDALAVPLEFQQGIRHQVTSSREPAGGASIREA
jgi:hypothetical protein